MLINLKAIKILNIIDKIWGYYHFHRKSSETGTNHGLESAGRDSKDVRDIILFSLDDFSTKGIKFLN